MLGLDRSAEARTRFLVAIVRIAFDLLVICLRERESLSGRVSRLPLLTNESAGSDCIVSEKLRHSGECYRLRTCRNRIRLTKDMKKAVNPSFDYSRTVFECSIAELCSDREDRN